MACLGWPLPAVLFALLLVGCTLPVDAVSLEDIVVAFPIDQVHMPLAIASRAWRKVWGLSPCNGANPLAHANARASDSPAA